MKISKLTVTAAAIAAVGLFLPASAVAATPETRTATTAGVDQTSAISVDPDNPYAGLQYASGAANVGELPPQTLLIPWDGDESDLTAEQADELQAAGVELAPENFDGPVEPIPAELIDQAGFCQMELGENVIDGLKECAAGGVDSGAQAQSSARATEAGGSADSVTSSAELQMQSAAADPNQPGLSPCAPPEGQERQIYMSRTSSCYAYDVSVGVIEVPSNRWVGSFILSVLNTTTTQPSSATFLNNFTSVKKSNSIGAAIGRTMRVVGAYGCSTPGCSTGTTTTYNGSSDGWWNTATGSTTMTLAKTQSTVVMENWTMSISLDGVGGTSQWSGLSLKPRCDNGSTGLANSKGCVFAEYIPTVNAPTTGVGGQVGQHIAKAVASGLPRLLTRTSPTQAVKNRDRICPRNTSLPRDDGYECDEYPFASTNEGGTFPVRTLPGCRWAEIAGSGPVGTSRCMLLGTDNQAAGSALVQFYKSNRVQPGDRFFVASPVS